MNRAGTPSGRATVASKTTFEALTVDSGEESPDEEVEQPIISDRSECYNHLVVVALLWIVFYTSSNEPPKPSKSALKKAQKLARTERRQQEKAAKSRAGTSQRSGSESPPAELKPSTESTQLSTQAPHSDPTLPSSEPSSQYEAPLAATNQPTEEQTPRALKYEDLLSSAEPSYPASMEISGRNSPEPVDSSIEKNIKADPLNAELQLALENKLYQQREAERTKKKQNALTRTIWGFAMIGGFIGALPL